MKSKPSAAIIAGIVVGLLVYALAGYFVLISPQRGKAASLKKETAATQQQIEQYRTLAAQAKATPPIRVAELFRLTKAMPDTIDMPGVLLELSRVARESGIEFDSITPQGPSVASGYSSFPTSSSGCAASSACTKGGWTRRVVSSSSTRSASARASTRSRASRRASRCMRSSTATRLRRPRLPPRPRHLRRPRLRPRLPPPRRLRPRLPSRRTRLPRAPARAQQGR